LGRVVKKVGDLENPCDRMTEDGGNAEIDEEDKLDELVLWLVFWAMS
jgi:hypothetical protein